jgi:uncharacterized membrane protein YcaP (DUF421 family)
MLESMFHLHLPILEKLIRPVIVYLVLIVFLRIFGKRELAQLNPFDLVVLLSLSNTVQNAIIGEDNSVTGGIIGAFSLLAINWILMRILYRLPKVNKALEGTSTVLIQDGKVDYDALKRETLTEEELLSALHKQSFDRYSDVRRCVLEPNGTFFIEGQQPSTEERDFTEIMAAVASLSTELQDLRKELRTRDAAR